MDRRRLWPLAVAALALVLGLAASASARPNSAAAPKVKSGGTLLFGAEQEPPCMNTLLNDCNNTWPAWINQMVFAGVYRIYPDYSYRLYLANKVDLQLNPMRLTYHLKPEAVWNDGKPITGNDLVFTWKTIANTAWDKKPTGGGIVSRAGYDLITKAKVFGPGNKNVTFWFKKPYAGWKELFSGGNSSVLPQHALQGEDFSKVFVNDYKNPKNGQEIASGPFVFKGWAKGSQIVLSRNPRWWGPHKPYLNTLILRFLTDTNTEIQQVRGGEVDAIYPQPQLPLSDLRGQKGLTIQSSLGTQYEHIDIQFGPKGNPIARNPWFRRALMMSIDRNEILKDLFSKLNPNLKPLDSVLYVTNQHEYQAHFGQWNYNPQKAAQLLEQHGCKKGGDGIYSCNGTRLSFGFESTKGNQLRELAFGILQQRLKANGIEVTNDFKPSNIAFGQDLVPGNWQLFMFAWVASPDPGPAKPIWICPNKGGTQNYMGYCNAKVTTLLNQADGVLQPAQRAATVNSADRLIGQDVPSVPLYQKPTFLVTHDYVKGMEDNPTNQGPFFNAQDWWLNK